MALKLTRRDDSSAWQIVGTVGGQRVRRSTKCKDYGRAEQVMAKFYYDAVNDKANPDLYTIADLIDAYLAKPGLKLGLRSHNILLKMKDYWKDVRAHLFGQESVNRYIKRYHSNNKANTIEREIRQLNAVFNYCEQSRMTSGIFRPVFDRVDDARVRWLEPEERDAYLAEASEMYRGFLTVLFYTGCRIGELKNLTWNDVTEDALVFRHWKGQPRKLRVRAVPMHDKVREVIESLTREPGRRVFPKRWYNYGRVYQEHTRICEALGIEDFKPHDIRHTFGTLLARKCTNPWHISKLMGHTNLTTSQRYIHLAAADFDGAVSLL